MKIHTARKDHWCDECNRKIPKGIRYWRKYNEGVEVDEKTHTNCLLFTDQPHKDDQPKRE